MGRDTQERKKQGESDTKAGRKNTEADKHREKQSDTDTKRQRR